jgi:hypothetical protein
MDSIDCTPFRRNTAMTASTALRCPRCSSIEVGRSHRQNQWERMVSVIVVPWRCRDCYARFFRPTWLRNTIRM